MKKSTRDEVIIIVMGLCTLVVGVAYYFSTREIERLKAQILDSANGKIIMVGDVTVAPTPAFANGFGVMAKYVTTAGNKELICGEVVRKQSAEPGFQQPATEDSGTNLVVDIHGKQIMVPVPGQFK